MKRSRVYLFIFMQSFVCFFSLAREAAATFVDCENKECLYLQSYEGEKFKIGFEAARLSEFVVSAINFKKSLGFDTKELEIFIDSKTLSQIVALCEAQVRSETLDLSLNTKEKIDLLQAIDFLLIKSFFDLQRKIIFDLILKNLYEELIIYDIDFERVLKFFFLEEYVRPKDFKDEIEGSDDYKKLYYSIKYPIYNLAQTLVGHNSLVISANFSPDGTKIVTASYDYTAKIWDVSTGELLHTLVGHDHLVRSANFSPDGSKVVTASADKTAKTWDVSTGELIHTLDAHTRSIEFAHFSPDDTKVITASDDKTAIIWDVSTGEILHTLKGHNDSVKSVSFSGDGLKIVTASDDWTAKIWDARTGQLLYTLSRHSGGVTSASFSHDGIKVLTSSWDQKARIWDVQSGALLHTLSGHSKWLMSANFSPDGRKIVTVSYDNTAKIWNARNGKLLFTLSGIYDIQFANFCNDGTRIITASKDKIARIWDADNASLIHSLEGHNRKIFSAIFSLDGTKILTASDDKTAKVWTTPYYSQSLSSNRLLQKNKKTFYENFVQKIREICLSYRKN